MGSPKKRLQYQYDARGNRSLLIDPDGGRFTYSYDSVGRMTRVLNPQGERTTFSYDAAGRRTAKRLANGTRTSFTYDPAGNLTLLTHRKTDGTLLSSFQYSYDKTGNRTRVVEADGSRTTWTYDATYQLRGEHRTGTTPYRNTFTFDSAGNRTLKNESGARTTYVYDAANQLRYAQASAGRTTYTFDADGNQQVVREPAGNRTTYVWEATEAADRSGRKKAEGGSHTPLTLERLPAGTRNTMAYDPEGLRVTLQEPAGTKKFVWEATEAADRTGRREAEGGSPSNYLAETDGANDTQVTYTNEPRTYGRLLSQRRGSTTSWFHFDALGSTRQLTNSSAVVSDTRLYDAWGVDLSSTGGTVFPFGYVGELGYYTDASGRLYVRARHLRATLGAWLSNDPLWITTHRLYSYVSMSMLTYADPSGLISDSILLPAFPPLLPIPVPIPIPSNVPSIPTEEVNTFFRCLRNMCLYQQWDPSLCSREDKDGGPCTCKETINGQPATGKEIRSQFEELFELYAAKMGLDRSMVDLRTPDICVTGLKPDRPYALTCLPGPRKNGKWRSKIIVCIPNSRLYSKCEFEELIIHELVHVSHILNSRPFPNEAEAYSEHCKVRLAHECSAAGDKEIKACVESLIKQSTNADAVEAASRACLNF